MKRPMYDPKFEKGVRQKMEGLEFIPSESVWANIQKAVAGQRHRRGGLFFWRFALPAALLGGLLSAPDFAARTGNTSQAGHPAATAAQSSVTAAQASATTSAQPAGTSAQSAGTPTQPAETSAQSAGASAQPVATRP